MGRTTLTLVLFLGPVCASCLMRGGPRGEDVRAIEALHARDAEAALAQDYSALRELWTEDGVMLAPGGPAVRGEELWAYFDAAAAAPRTLEVLEYSHEFQELEVHGDVAWEWGIARGRSRDLETGRVEEGSFKLLRILRRESDGEWRVHRAIWNALD